MSEMDHTNVVVRQDNNSLLEDWKVQEEQSHNNPNNVMLIGTLAISPNNVMQIM